MTLRDDVKIVTGCLVERYKVGKLGVPNVNYIFTCNDIPLTLNNRMIGRILTEDIAPTGIIKLWSVGHVRTWKTCFNGGP